MVVITMGPSGIPKEGKMNNIAKIRKSAAVRIWRVLSPQGLNHPMVCAPSEWLLERLAESFESDAQISKEIWKIACRAFALHYPGLERPLGSCYHPDVHDVLDVVYHYGAAAQRALRKTAAAAAVVVTSQRELWTKSDVFPTEEGTYYVPPTGKGFRHVELTAGYLGRLADAVREGRAPEVRDIRPEFFEVGWDARIEAMRRIDAKLREQYGELAALVARDHRGAIVESTSDHLDWSERWYDNGHCPNGRTTNRMETDGRKVVISSEETEAPQGYFCGGGRREIRVDSATYAVDVQYEPRVGYRLGRVYLWPGYNPATVAEALHDAMNLK